MSTEATALMVMGHRKSAAQMVAMAGPEDVLVAYYKGSGDIALLLSPGIVIEMLGEAGVQDPTKCILTHWQLVPWAKVRHELQFGRSPRDIRWPGVAS